MISSSWSRAFPLSRVGRRVWVHLGTDHGRPDLRAAGEAMLNETAPLMADIRAAIERSAVPAGGGLVCHPYVAGEGACADMNREGAPPHARVSHTTFPYNARASEPWRAYSSMMYAGGLSRAVATAIVRHQQNRSRLSRIGVWGGGPGFDNRLMGPLRGTRLQPRAEQPPPMRGRCVCRPSMCLSETI